MRAATRMNTLIAFQRFNLEMARVYSIARASRLKLVVPNCLRFVPLFRIFRECHVKMSE